MGCICFMKVSFGRKGIYRDKDTGKAWFGKMENNVNEFKIEGRNAVIEAFRAGKSVDKVYILDGCQDGPVLTIKRQARKQDVQIKYVPKDS